MLGMVVWEGLELPIRHFELREGRFHIETETVVVPEGWTCTTGAYTVVGADGTPVYAGIHMHGGVLPGDTLQFSATAQA